METEVPCQLTNDLLKAIHVTNVALTQAKAQHMSLKVKAGKIKNQIQDDVSYHLELLRNREVWLMEQADMLLHLKEESIENHRKELCAVLAKLEILLEFLKIPELGQSPELAEKVSKVLSSIPGGFLNADEFLDICFIVDNFALSDAIKEFGRINEQESGTETTQHFVRSGQKRNQFSSKTQDIFFIQEYFNAVWNSPASDWLVDSSADHRNEKLCDQRPDDGVGNFYAAIQQSDPKDWLHKEEQPFFLKTITEGFTRHFQEVKNAPLTDWVVKSSIVAPTSTRKNNTVRFQPFDASERLDSWLLAPNTTSQTIVAGHTVISHESDQRSDVAKMEKNITHDSTWLLKANDVKLNLELKQEKDKIKEEKDSESWLQSRSGSTPTTPTNQCLTERETWLKKFRESMGGNDSDWLIVPTGIQPKYCEWLSRESQDMCKDCPRDCDMDTLKVFRDISDSPRNQWLATATDW